MAVETTEFGRDTATPVFSICVPQYNRTSFFKLAIISYAQQNFGSVEVCVSDGGSTDGRHGEVIGALRGIGLPFVFYRSEQNLRYDSNLRKAITLARGRYCVLMGNDDALNGAHALDDLWKDIQAHSYPGVILNDSCDHTTGRRAMRIRRTGDRGGGPVVAAMHYRNFSFVSGVVLDRSMAQSFSTLEWDGAEMYQTYLGCRIIASSRNLLERGVAFTRKDLVVTGETVDGIARAKRIWPCPIIERRTTLTDFGRLVSAAIAPYSGKALRSLNERIMLQHLGITMGYWLFTYRKLQSWRYALGIALGLRPTRSAEGVELGLWRRLRVWTVYICSCIGGLTIPPSVFHTLEHKLYKFAKSIR